MSGKSQTIQMTMMDGDKESCSNFPRHIMIRLTTMLGNLQIKIHISTTRDIDELSAIYYISDKSAKSEMVE